MCGLLKLFILSLTSKEFSGGQQNSFCLCRSEFSFWKLVYYHYWHEFLDLVYVFKCLVSLSDPDTQSPPRVCCWIRLGPTPSPLRTVFTVDRAPRIWNTLPDRLRNAGCSVVYFKVSVKENFSTLLDFGFFGFLAKVGPKFYFGRKRKSESAF